MKKNILIITLIITLLIPAININYYSNGEIISKKQSVLNIIVNDIKDGAIGTGL